MTTIKTIAACARQTCATGRFSVNPYAGMGKLENRLKSAVIQFLPVLENTMGIAGNLPDSEVFSRPEFKDASIFGRVYGFGRDGLVRKAGRMAIPMFSTSRPPVALEKAASGFQSRIGAETMTPITPKTGNPTSLARLPAIEAALSDALDLVRTTRTQHGIQLATGRAIRAASLLKQACAEIQIGRAA